MSVKDYKILGINEGTLSVSGYHDLNILIFKISEIEYDLSNPDKPSYIFGLFSTNIIALDRDSNLATKMEIVAREEELISLDTSEFLPKIEEYEGIKQKIYYHKDIYDPKTYLISELYEDLSWGLETVTEEILQVIAQEIKKEYIEEENSSKSEFETILNIPINSPLARKIKRDFEVKKEDLRITLNMANWSQYSTINGKFCDHVDFKKRSDTAYVSEQINKDYYKCIFLDPMNHMALQEGIKQGFFPKPKRTELIANDKHSQAGFKIYLSNDYYKRLLNNINMCVKNNNFPKLGIYNEKPSHWINFKNTMKLAKRPNNFNKDFLVYHYLSL